MTASHCKPQRSGDGTFSELKRPKKASKGCKGWKKKTNYTTTHTFRSVLHPFPSFFNLYPRFTERDYLLNSGAFQAQPEA